MLGDDVSCCGLLEIEKEKYLLINVFEARYLTLWRHQQTLPARNFFVALFANQNIVFLRLLFAYVQPYDWDMTPSDPLTGATERDTLAISLARDCIMSYHKEKYRRDIMKQFGEWVSCEDREERKKFISKVARPHEFIIHNLLFFSPLKADLLGPLWGRKFPDSVTFLWSLGTSTSIKSI